MIQIPIPGNPTLEIEHLVLDYNGTLAFDGKVLLGVNDMLNDLSQHVQIYVITADTFGKAADQLTGINCTLRILESDNHTQEKAMLVETLGAAQTIAIGNGRNDAAMLKAAAIGIAVLQSEGLSFVTLQSADILTATILDALELLRNPMRMVATLRE
jgi:P-type E1-E2 ATPase